MIHVCLGPLLSPAFMVCAERYCSATLPPKLWPLRRSGTAAPVAVERPNVGACATAAMSTAHPATVSSPCWRRATVALSPCPRKSTVTHWNCGCCLRNVTAGVRQLRFDPRMPCKNMMVCVGVRSSSKPPRRGKRSNDSVAPGCCWYWCWWGLATVLYRRRLSLRRPAVTHDHDRGI